MCFSLVALAGVPIRINDPECVAKTFPDYFERFAQITAPAEVGRRRGAGASRLVLQRVPVIAIDGPSASGKGTVARRVAEALGFRFLDSGALYRLVALPGVALGRRPRGRGGPRAGGHGRSTAASKARRCSCRASR